MPEIALKHQELIMVDMLGYPSAHSAFSAKDDLLVKVKIDKNLPVFWCELAVHSLPLP
ncbi:hypothetical protein [Rhodopirellula bahusiensis]|uniref:hypothetical protein n=1 Tax=Rhodopirellula bahusiensis TaxID=2014065 RepID=UPI0032646D41